MVPFPIIDERIIWFVVFTYYVFDNLYLIDDRHVIILENYRFQWTFQLSAIPFAFRGKHLYLLPLIPYSFAFKLPWLTSDNRNNYKITRCYRRFYIWRSKLLDFRILAVCAWINLFVIGPALTTIAGFIFALKYVVPIHLMLLLSCLFLIILKSRRLNFSPRMVFSQMVELTLCPGYLPNICRRLSLTLVCEDADGILFIKRYGQPSTVEAVIDIAQFRLLEMRPEVEDNPDALRELGEYSAEIRF